MQPRTCVAAADGRFSQPQLLLQFRANNIAAGGEEPLVRFPAHGLTVFVDVYFNEATQPVALIALLGASVYNLVVMLT